MRKLIYLSVILIISAGACSKKNETKIPANTVSIGGVNYGTVVIGTQTWTTTNYDGPTALAGFYTIAQATAISLPAGWRLPAKNDFDNLLKLAGATQDSNGFFDNANALEFMSTTGWSAFNGTNSLGFNAMPFGYALSPGPNFIGSGITAAFWSSSLLVPGEPIDLVIYAPSNSSSGNASLDKLNPGDYASVRFVKDN